MLDFFMADQLCSQVTSVVQLYKNASVVWPFHGRLIVFTLDVIVHQVPMLRNLEYVSCYYITRSYKTQDYGYCMRTTNYRDLSYAVSFLPYYWRAMQVSL